MIKTEKQTYEKHFITPIYNIINNITKACMNYKNFKKRKQKILGKNYTLFIADTPAKRRHGFSGVKEIPRNHGILFYYEKPEIRILTMKKTYCKLKILFFDQDFNCIKSVIAKPRSSKLISSDEPAMYVIEIPV